MANVADQTTPLDWHDGIYECLMPDGSINEYPDLDDYYDDYSDELFELYNGFEYA